MTRPVFDRTDLARMTRCTMRTLAVMLSSARGHAADFRVLVPWPALAQSFDQDAAVIERVIAGRREVAA